MIVNRCGMYFFLRRCELSANREREMEEQNKLSSTEEKGFKETTYTWSRSDT